MKKYLPFTGTIEADVEAKGSGCGIAWASSGSGVPGGVPEGRVGAAAAAAAAVSAVLNIAVDWGLAGIVAVGSGSGEAGESAL